MNDKAAIPLHSLLKPKPLGEIEDVDNYPCYGCVRGNRRAFNIELRRLQGSWPAPEYAWLHYAEWCPVATTLPDGTKVPGGSSVLHFQSGEKVLVSGRNVRELHSKLLEHQVNYIAEADRTTDMAANDDTVIVTSVILVDSKTR